MSACLPSGGTKSHGESRKRSEAEPILVPTVCSGPITSHDPWIGIYALLTRRDRATGHGGGAQFRVFRVLPLTYRI